MTLLVNTKQFKCFCGFRGVSLWASTSLNGYGYVLRAPESAFYMTVHEEQNRTQFSEGINSFGTEFDFAGLRKDLSIPLMGL